MAINLYWLAAQLAQVDASLSVAAVPALSHLKKYDEFGAPRTKADLTAHLRMKPADVSVLLQKLQDHGLAARLAKGKYSLSIIGLELMKAAGSMNLMMLHESIGSWRAEHRQWPQPADLAKLHEMTESVVAKQMEAISRLGVFGGFGRVTLAKQAAPHKTTKSGASARK